MWYVRISLIRGRFSPYHPYRYDYDDPAVERQFEYLRTFLQESTAGPLTTTPWLKKVQPFKGIYENIRETMKA